MNAISCVGGPSWARIRVSATLNRGSVDALRGGRYAPVRGGRDDLVGPTPPQMPTPSGRERSDAVAAADNGGVDGWRILDRVIDGAPEHLAPGGRLVFSIFAFLGRKRAFARLEAHALTPTVLATEVQAFPRIGYERLEHIRSLDVEGALALGVPATVERLIVQGTRA